MPPIVLVGNRYDVYDDTLEERVRPSNVKKLKNEINAFNTVKCSAFKDSKGLKVKKAFEATVLAALFSRGILTAKKIRKIKSKHFIFVGVPKRTMSVTSNGLIETLIEDVNPIIALAVSTREKDEKELVPVALAVEVSEDATGVDGLSKIAIGNIIRKFYEEK